MMYLFVSIYVDEFKIPSEINNIYNEADFLRKNIQSNTQEK